MASLEEQQEPLQQDQEALQRNLQRHLDLLVHASRCRRVECIPNCGRMKVLLQHLASCTIRAQGGCVRCRRVLLLREFHAKSCKQVMKCQVPRCEVHRQALERRSMKREELETRAYLSEHRKAEIYKVCYMRHVYDQAERYPANIPAFLQGRGDLPDIEVHADVLKEVTEMKRDLVVELMEYI